MKKSLRSVTKNEQGVYEYLRVDVEEAARLESIGGYIYISKEEFKRKSKFYQFVPCNGTLIKQIDGEGNVSYKSLHNINYAKNLGEQFPSSTKIAKCSMQISQVRRKDKYGIKKSHKLEENA